ncbi:uncharacterized protein BJ171DRAFT_492687 [Polychytrium aggregatum]|uniref:uncharacterized protein n=1 Tax=Polychytrium aggregatum TaxID=110093 RepID=UPI0022FEEF29|nr:uncharacterized protein BJ171DRAFT_492687 [Polychytrium aggregatum]KAI9207424.1 hypothetical protein BJ171DRAFT_492687 [Polychytrium aggregatum]
MELNLFSYTSVARDDSAQPGQSARSSHLPLREAPARPEPAQSQESTESTDDLDPPPTYNSIVPPFAIACSRFVAHRRWIINLVVTAGVFVFLTVMFVRTGSSGPANHCTQPPPMSPSTNTSSGHQPWSAQVFTDPEWQNLFAKRLGQAISFQTVSYDSVAGAGLSNPTNYSEFDRFHQFLQSSYPRIHDKFAWTKVANYSLVYILKGSDPLLKPMMLSAHQDVAPVSPTSAGQWFYPPFSGTITSGYIWGRGASDAKNSMMAMLEAIESLLTTGFEPRRTIIMAFGHDEETESAGAQAIAAYLEANGYLGNVEFVLNDGSMIRPELDTNFASIGTAEKGYMDIQITVRTPGGSSVVMPIRSSIAVLSAIIGQLQITRFTPKLHDLDPFMVQLRCYAEHAPPSAVELSQDRRNLIMGGSFSRTFLIKILSESPVLYSMMATTETATVIQGGHKSNTLPDQASAVLNHRIASFDSSTSVRKHIVDTVRRMEEAFGFEIFLYDENTNIRTAIRKVDTASHGDPKFSGAQYFEAISFGEIEVRVLRGTVEPSVVSDSFGSEPFDVLVGTIRHVFEPRRHGSYHPMPDQRVYGTPTLEPGSTDAKWYRNLTSNIFRFSPFFSNETFGSHDVNERIGQHTYSLGVLFYHELVRNFDEGKRSRTRSQHDSRTQA